ncbi:unnamed protein product [Umbelopsis ramanniana]
MNFCERCQRTYSSFSSLRRHRLQHHQENLAHLPPGPAPHPTARIITADEARAARAARAASAKRDLRRREIEEMERVVADYLVGLPRPTPETAFWYLGHLLDQAGLDPHDVTVFHFGAQLQQPPAVHRMSLRQRRSQQDLYVDAVAAAQQMLSQRPHLLGRFEFLFVAFCACSAQQ